MNDVGVDVSAAGARSTSLSDTASLYQLPVDVQTLFMKLSQWNGLLGDSLGADDLR